MIITIVMIVIARVRGDITPYSRVLAKVTRGNS